MAVEPVAPVPTFAPLPVAIELLLPTLALVPVAIAFSALSPIVAP